ncbi:metallophosphoesterase [Sphingomonas parva]|uniref:Metallophosphoesterase n=1 Tax=Sphingomonas parva TaxID=2555898 RepID=A0A4Y8ZMB8_9SPHN|nr:metallophosphatase domain-containing protein [Sphingomonas parva]TFI56295.1 metallophosphoesterase [Sphingomonas parva]
MDVRVTIVSDTHGRHRELALPGGDILIHCGDMFDLFGAPPDLAEIDRWFGEQPYERILCTGGNHDRALEATLARRPQPFRNAWFLRDARVEVGGLTIFGSPWVPDLPTHAFHKRQAALAALWAEVPAGPDVLVTHTPPNGVLDQSRSGQSLGCRALASEIGRIAPRLHCFGHVHASAGQRRIGETLFVNASSIESGTGRMRAPVTLTLSAG